jgi:deoxyribose-phosphate aldolase
MDIRQLAASIDQTLLKPTVGEREAREWMGRQRDAGFASLCVSPFLVPAATEILTGTRTKVCTVVAFPLGYAVSASKADEARRLVELGAVEIDMVMNVAAALEGCWDYVGEDIAAVVRATNEASGGQAIVKVILECAYLTGAEMIADACRVAVASGTDFVKTSTGFAPTGATHDDLRLMRANTSPHTRVKAAGGVRTLDDMLLCRTLGASRLGATPTVAILDEAKKRGIGDTPVPIQSVMKQSSLASGGY